MSRARSSPGRTSAIPVTGMTVRDREPRPCPDVTVVTGPVIGVASRC